MKVLGIVAEYNPFHNGHMYHIKESKRLTGCDAVVCIMSGNFIQRGEPAVVNKFTRAEMALKNGVDLVIELPVPFAMASAEVFGYGAVKILDSIGIVDYLSFGSELGDVGPLQTVADIVAGEPVIYKEELKKQLSSGISFPAARQAALKKYLDNDDSLSSLLETSNNILAIEYLKALKKLSSRIKPITIKRIANAYNSEQLTGSISSATAIRNHLLQSDVHVKASNSLVYHAVPEATRQLLDREFTAGKGPNSLASFECTIFALLRQLLPEQIRRIPDVTEGLEYRIKQAVENTGSIEELMGAICTKRYTRTRIQRILLSTLTSLTKEDMDAFMRYGGPQYCRILGFTETGRELLPKIKKNSILPLVTKTSQFKTSCNKLLTRMLSIEAQATDLYVLAYKNPAFRKAGQEFTSNIIFP